MKKQAASEIVNGVESDRFTDFFTSVTDLFDECFNLRPSEKKIEIGVRSNLRRILVSAEQYLVHLAKLGRRSFKML